MKGFDTTMIFALAGNPNCGKTTIFNHLTHSLLYVGNRPGVTVDKAGAPIFGHKDTFLVDLPGTYSLTPYTDDERVSCNFLKSSPPDCIINVIDATAPERSLYLTTLLAELHIPMIIVVSMEDILIKGGGSIDKNKLSRLFNCRVTSDYDKIAEFASEAVNKKIIPSGFDEKDINKRYKRIANELSDIYIPPKPPETSDKIDKILTGKFTGIPVFLLIMAFIYYLSVSVVGAAASAFTSDILLPKISLYTAGVLEIFGASPIFHSFVINGIIGGVGSVLCFIPQLTMLFILLVFLEDCGYMARAAFITDKLLCGAGLSGKCFIPMIIASGCSAPAILTSRTLESKSDRCLCAATLSFIPCSAKLPVIITIGQTAADGAWWFAPLMYIIGLASIMISSVILKNMSLMKCDSTPFIMELPPYKLPTVKNLFLHTANRLGDFIKKAGSVLLFASTVLWFLSSFRYSGGRIIFTSFSNASLLAAIGKGIAHLFKPIGFGSWQAAVAVFSGFIAKESIISTVGMLGSFSALFNSTAALCSFLVFNLLNPPCAAAMSAMYTILNKRRFFAAITYQIAFSYAAAWLVFHLLSLIM